jgi:tyrosine-protein phosphatase SIW14
MLIHNVREGLYRGSRPIYPGSDFKTLSELGIKYIFNLEDNTDAIKAEKVQTDCRGIIEISIPMGEILPPSMGQLNYISNWTLGASKDNPMFVHCLHGVDRTGAAIFADRIRFSAWTFEKAYQEMIDMGHHVFWYRFWRRRLREFARAYEN